MTTTTTATTQVKWPTIIQVIFTGIAVLIAGGIAVLTLIAGTVELFSPSNDPYAASTMLSVFIGSLMLGVMLLAPLYFGVMRLSGRVVKLGNWWERLRRWFHPKRFLAALPAILFLGYLSIETELTRNLLLPFFNVLSLSIPVLVLVWLAVRGLPKGSPQLGWGAFSLGLAIGPSIVLILELIAFVLVIIGLVVSAAANPELMDVFASFDAFSFEVSDPYVLDRLVGDLFTSPQVLTAFLVFLSGFVPLIEELFKPISVWVLLGRKLRAVDGWVIGAFSGAGFALFENLGNASVTQDWAFSVLSRAGATIPHIFTAALMGYTMALAHTQKKYGRVFLTFLGVVAIHGAWNASFVLNIAASLAPSNGLLDQGWAPVFLALVGVLALGMLIALMRINRKLRRETVEAVPEDLLNQYFEQDSKEIQTHGTDHDTD
jgi:RsiW-degrading membrane proteinase PrsW (M82 family)